jgi:hypothetical protein
MVTLHEANIYKLQYFLNSLQSFRAFIMKISIFLSKMMNKEHNNFHLRRGVRIGTGIAKGVGHLNPKRAQPLGPLFQGLKNRTPPFFGPSCFSTREHCGYFFFSLVSLHYCQGISSGSDKGTVPGTPIFTAHFCAPLHTADMMLLKKRANGTSYFRFRCTLHPRGFSLLFLHH